MAMPGGLPSLRVQLFGDAGVRGVGGEIPLTPLQLALVTLVYGHAPEGLSRPNAARLLWGADDSSRSRQKIRQHLHDIRLRVGRPIIDTPADILRPLPGVGCDLPIFENALQKGPLREAAALVRRGFIPTAVAPAEPFDDWRTGRSTRLLREVRTRAFTQWSQAFEQGDWGEARDAAEALYTLDPEDPQAVERVVEARGRMGDLGSAEAAFTGYVAGLASGCDPPDELIETMDRVRAIGRVDGEDAEPDKPKVPFVGRRRALDIARGSLDAVERGRFELMLISGESGIGKTRVLDEIHREAILREFRCLRARPVELERGIPLNPLLDAFAGIDLAPHLTAVGAPWNGVIASLLPHGALDHPPEEPPPIQPSSLSRRLLDSFALLFECLARDQKTILFIDDLQWADATTIAALQFMQRRWTRGSLGVFATLRPQLVRLEDPLAKYLSAAEGLQARQIELPPLTTAEARELVDVIAKGATGDVPVERLCAIAGHHPLYLTELTRDFLAGRLTLPERASDQVTIPTSLGQMLDARLEAMDHRALRVAGVLAVAAKPLRITDIAKLANLSLDDAASAVDALTRARFIEVEKDHGRIAHELFRSAVYRHLSGPRRAIHHRAIAEHLLSHSRDDVAGEVALHFASAGEAQLAAEHGWAAARRALDAGALAEAIQFFEVVAECEPDPVRRADATADLARALHLSRDITRANPQLQLAADRLRSTGRPHLARRLEIKRMEGLAEVDAAPVEELLEQLATIKAKAREEEDWESVALALDVELHLLHRNGDVEGIRELLRELRDVARKESVEARLLARTGLALGVFFDDPEEALVAAREAVELADEGKGYRLRALARLLVVLQALGMLELPESEAVIGEARALAERAGDVLQRFSIESNLAVASLDAGDLERAHVLMSRSTALLGRADMDLSRFNQANNRAELALACGEIDEAAHAFVEAATFLGSTMPRYTEDVVNAGLGYCSLEAGDLSEARQREAELNPAPALWYFDPTTILTFRSRLLERRGQRGEALQLLEDAAANLKDRLVLAWLKVRLLQAGLMVKDGRADVRTVATEALRRAHDLNLIRRARDFERILERLG